MVNDNIKENINDEELFSNDIDNEKLAYSTSSTPISSEDAFSLATNQNQDEKIDLNDKYKDIQYYVNDNLNNEKQSLCCSIVNIILGFLILAIAITLVIIPIQTVVMKESLNMEPHMPPFIWWKNPKPEILFRVFIFSVKNSEAFMSGKNSTLEIEEVGPIVYTEELLHTDIVYNKENSTLSYTVRRRPIFQADRNIPGIMNKTIIVPNLSTLGYAGYLFDDNYFTRKAFEMAVITARDTLFLNTTIYNYLWNATSPTIKLIKNILPFMVPMDNMGILHIIYNNWADRVNVNIGPKYGHEDFFKINTYDYRPTVPGYFPEDGDCFASIVDSSEGAAYPQKLTEDDTLVYWRKTLCRPAPLTFEKKMKKDSLIAYKYLLRENTYDRLKNRTADCYRGNEIAELPDGLSDLSKCFYHLPLAASFPHFYFRTGPWIKKLNGLQPNSSNHESYIVIEPNTGVAMDQVARSQSNLVLPDLSGFSLKFSRFSNTVIPMFWLEYHQKEMTPSIISTISFMLNYLPSIQTVLSFSFLLLGTFLIGFGIYKILDIQYKYKKRLFEKNNIFQPDVTPFLEQNKIQIVR